MCLVKYLKDFFIILLNLRRALSTILQGGRYSQRDTSNKLADRLE